MNSEVTDINGGLARTAGKGTLYESSRVANGTRFGINKWGRLVSDAKHAAGVAAYNNNAKIRAALGAQIGVKLPAKASNYKLTLPKNKPNSRKWVSNSRGHIVSRNKHDGGVAAYNKSAKLRSGLAKGVKALKAWRLSHGMKGGENLEGGASEDAIEGGEDLQGGEGEDISVQGGRRHRRSRR